MEHAPLVTLLTDFGLTDGYVGTMKGVVLSIAPRARLVDISHEIAPQDVAQAAYVLYVSCPFFPAHSVHLVVVDPGVGGTRRSIALSTPSGMFVGPDNGVFSYVMYREPVKTVVELSESRFRLVSISQTFHGRDIFAPAAAHLATGVPITALGPSVTDPVMLPRPTLGLADGGIVGEVMHIDHFGNVISSIGRLCWEQDALLLQSAFGQLQEPVRFGAAQAVVEMAGYESTGVRHTYAEAEAGMPLVLVGSSGHLEIAVRNGSAAEELGLRRGDKVIVRLTGGQ
jgi:S-adenosylmethionine hydrolase